jgi:hypothetical protein
MANNYLQFSFAIPNITGDEAAWIREYLAYAERIADYDNDAWSAAIKDQVPPAHDPLYASVQDNGSLGFEWEIDDEDGLWIYAEESGDPDSAALLVQKFLATHRPNAYVGFEWAATCSKMRLDEFGGGAAIITATEITWNSTSAWVQEQKDRLHTLHLTEA